MRKKNIIVLIILLAVGFASVATTLIINGNIGVQTNKDNFIDGLVFDDASLRTSNNNIIAEISESGRTITFITQELTKVNDTSTVYFKIKNYSQYDATLGRPAISCYFVDGHQVDEKATSKGTTHEYVQLIPGRELDGDKILGGGVELSEESNVTVKQIKSYTGAGEEVTFQCEINADAGDSDTPAVEKPIILLELPEGVTLTNDKNEDGIADIGDEITIGTESFYVMSHTKTKINALAKYNLNVGDNPVVPAATYGIQNEKARGWMDSSTGITKYGNVVFSKAAGWTKGVDPIEIRKEVYRYGSSVTVDTMTALDVLYTSNETYTGYEDYIRRQVPDSEKTKISVRLISKSEIETLVNGGDTLTAENIKTKADNAGYPWLYSTSYWTQSGHSELASYVWRVNSDGGFGGSGFGFAGNEGVRPVITISK